MNKFDRNIKINYIFTFLKNVDLTRGIWMLFLAYKGMSLFEIGMLEGIFHVTSFLMEMPTGAIADIFGRKFSRLLSVGVTIISSLLIVYSKGFIGCAIAFGITALSYNFESGAGEALVYDSLKHNNKEKRFMKVTGYIEVVVNAAAIVGLITGGIIGTFSYETIYFIVIGMSVLIFVIGLFFAEPVLEGEKKESEKKKGKFLEVIKNQYVDAFKILKASPRLMYIIIFGAVISTFITLSFFYLQISWKEFGYDEWQIGIFLALSSVFGSIGGLVAEKVDKKVGDINILKYSPYFVMLCVPLFYFVKFSMIPFALICLVDSIIYVATRDYINQLIPSDKRATIISFDSAMFSLSMILLFPVFGLISDHIGINRTFLILGGILVVLTVINMVLLNSRKKVRREGA